MSKHIVRCIRLTMVAGALLLSGGRALADDAPSTADVLGKLHLSDQKEIEAGKLAQKMGQSQQLRDYGKMLVKDHGAADKKVAGLAKQEKVNLAASTPAMGPDDMSAMAADPAFDQKFAREMLDDHRKAISEVTEARDNTKDDKLKKLLSDLLPTLQKHADTAQKILDTGGMQK